MSKKKLLTDGRPQKLFRPKTRRGTRKSDAYLSRRKNSNITFENFKNTNLFSTASYRYGDKKGIVSTQEINIDYSEFVNHTFFHSAVAKVNEAFELILNEFPFDGSNKKIESFEDGLTGYEKYVYDIYPKNVGYLIFSGTQKGEVQSNGTHIQVNDSSAASITSIASSKKPSIGLNPGSSPFNAQFFINVPKQSNDNQVILQKSENLAYNINLVLSESLSIDSCKLMFTINSGSNSLSSEILLPKGEFVHVTAEYHDCNQYSSLMTLADSIEDHNYATSSNRVFFNSLKPKAPVMIGQGDTFRIDRATFTPPATKNTFVPQQSFSGSIDELRIFHKAIPKKEIKKYHNRSVSGHDNLKLYFKFNEPEGDYEGNDIVLDASGNNFSSRIKNYNLNYNRSTGSHASNPVKMENINHSPVLFPKYQPVVSLNTALMTTAALYDDYNPNLITKLVPPHYFELGNHQDNFDKVLGKLDTAFSTYTNPRPSQNTVTSVQLLAKLLLSWAKMFDEIKIFVDHFAKINFVEYEDYETVSNKLLQRLGVHLGLDLPSVFGSGNIDQTFLGFDLKNEAAKSTKTLYELQNMIWRRILSDVSNITKTKGSLDSIRSVFRSSGIEAENVFNFREYGGSKKRSLNGSRATKKDVISFLSFSGSIGNENSATLNAQGLSLVSPYVMSPFLSSSRKEPGSPKIIGDYVNKTELNPHGESNNTSDGLFTSSSFSVLGYYLFDQRLSHTNQQSLFRLNVTGSSVHSLNQASVVNVVADRSNRKITAHISDGIIDSQINSFDLSGVNIFDGAPWAICLTKNDGVNTKNKTKDEYRLSAAKYIDGYREDLYQTSSFIKKQSDSVLSKVSTSNTSGSFVIIGSQSFGTISKFLNSGDSAQKHTIFSGEVSYFNFWSKHKTDNEFIAYAKNPNSTGVQKPAINYNFSTSESGSFERIRIQTHGKQKTKSASASGKIRLFDFTQNDLHLEGHNFQASKVAIKPKDIIYEILSENFDLNSSKEKIRIRSFQNANYLPDNEYSTIAPIYETPSNEEVFDDTRFSIDMSVMKGLNENIMTIFPDFQPIDNALGQPNTLFGSSYPDMNAFRRVYFNNLIEDIDLGRYRTIFKWIDNSYTDLVYSLVPRTTNFMGINFIYESHVLERSKLKYHFDEIYLKSIRRDCGRVPFLLSQYVSKICKF